MDFSPEYLILRECTKELEIALKDKEDIVHFMECNDFITREIHDEVLNPKSYLTSLQKARKLVEKVKDKVQLDSRNYYVFINKLRSNTGMYREIIGILDSKFIKHSFQSTKDQGSMQLPWNCMRVPKHSDSTRDTSVKKSEKLHKQFIEILHSFFMYLKDRKEDAKNLIWLLQEHIKYPPILETNEKVSISDVRSIKDAADVMNIVVVYASFFNFKLLEMAIKLVEFKAGIEKMERYKEDFENYVKEITISECPSNIGILDENHRTTFHFKLDELYKNCNQHYLLSLKEDLCKILNIEEEVLCIHSVEKGCVSVVFHLPISFQDKVFPLSQEKIDALRNINYNGFKILKVLCDSMDLVVDLSFPESSPQTRQLGSKLEKASKQAQIGSLLSGASNVELYHPQDNKHFNFHKRQREDDPDHSNEEPSKRHCRYSRASTSDVEITSSSNNTNTVMADFALSHHTSKDVGKGSAIPLCIPNDMMWDEQTNECTLLEDKERTMLSLNPKAMEILRSITGPVCVIAIVGPCRSGKSYILSRLISDTGSKCHFHLGHKMDPKTRGIWMWDQPFYMKLKNYDRDVAIILLDTEGVDAANATEHGDSQIFTLSVLLSSLLIYNSMQVPKRADLTQMSFVANLSKSIQVQTGKAVTEEEGRELADYNPKFMWLLRDVALISTDKQEKECHIKDYLLSKVFMEGKKDNDVQKKTTECILSFFCSFEAETLPSPSTDPEVLQNIENPMFQDRINEEFLKKVEVVKNKIFDLSVPRKGFTMGSIVSGCQLANMIEIYIEALNTPGGVPVIGSTWQRVLEATYADGTEKALIAYKDIMDTVNLPMDIEKFMEIHRKAMEEAIKKFNRAVSLDNESELYGVYLGKLKGQIALYDAAGNCTSGILALYSIKNYEESKSICENLVNDLRKRHQDPLLESLSPDMDFKTIKDAFADVIALYNAKCIGPASNDVRQSFLQDQDRLLHQLEAQLETTKNYDAEAKKKMKEMKERQDHFQEEMQSKLEQAKKDEEASLKAIENQYEEAIVNIKTQKDKDLKDQEERLRNMANAQLEELKQNYKDELESTDKLAKQVEELITKQQEYQDEIKKKQDQIKNLQESKTTGNDDDDGICVIL